MTPTRTSESSAPQRFMGTIFKIWMMRFVDVPEEIGRALEEEYGSKKHIPVLAVVNTRTSRTTLMPAGAGRYRLQLNTALRKAARADVGDLIGVELRLDRASREMPVPSDLAQALRAHPRARAVFDKMGPGTRRQLLMYLERSKSPRVRKKVVARFLEVMLERALLQAKRRKSGKARAAQKPTRKRSPRRAAKEV